MLVVVTLILEFKGHTYKALFAELGREEKEQYLFSRHSCIIQSTTAIFLGFEISINMPVIPLAVVKVDVEKVSIILVRVHTVSNNYSGLS